MTFTLLIIGIILSVMAALVTMILGIVHLSSGKSRTGIILGVSFIMTLIVMVLCIVEVVKRGSGKIQEGVEWLKDQDRKNDKDYDWKAESNASQYYAFIPEGIKDSVSPKFYDAGDNEKYNIPLVYPYRFVSNEAIMVSFCKLENFLDTKDSALKDLSYISFFTFDDKMLMAKRDNMEMMRQRSDNKSDLPDYTYFLFDFSTGKIQSFMNEDRMFEEAQKRGYTGAAALESNYTHYRSYSGD